jgi:AraC family transcriptional regulator
MAISTFQNEARRRHKINRVINHVRHWDAENLDLDHLADVACLSRYHFSRLFTQYCQETPLAFVTRIRLEQAVSNLIFQPDMDITSVALTAGFSSSQSFSNGFRRRFSIPPRQFRNQNLGYIQDFPENQFVISPVMSPFQTTPCLFQQDRVVNVRQLPKTRLAYVRTRGPYYLLSSGYDSSLKKLKNWAKARDLWAEETPIIGVCPDNPAVTPPELCQYDYGLEVEHGVEEDQTISIQILPERTVATLDVFGSLMVQKEAWKWFISDWLPQSGFVFSGHAFYETFKLIPEGQDASKTTLCIQISPKS